MAAEKTEKPEATAPAPAPSAADAAAAPKGGGIAGFIPLIIALIVAPVLSWVVFEFVMLPRMKSQLLAASGEPPAAAVAAGHGESAATEPKAEPKTEPKKSEGKKPEAKKGEAKKGERSASESPGSYQFDNIVVNLSGTMGTRYLKTSFLITGKENLAELFEKRHPELLDATLNTLGSLTLADLEEVGSRNLIRARLIAAYNEVIGVRVVEQIYFSEFVVQ